MKDSKFKPYETCIEEPLISEEVICHLPKTNMLYPCNGTLCGSVQMAGMFSVVVLKSSRPSSFPPILFSFPAQVMLAGWFQNQLTSETLVGVYWLRVWALEPGYLGLNLSSTTNYRLVFGHVIFCASDSSLVKRN